MWDVQLQRRAVMNEMRQMAARPFASVEMQLNPENKLLTVEQPSPVSIWNFMGGVVGSKNFENHKMLWKTYIYCRHVTKFLTTVMLLWQRCSCFFHVIQMVRHLSAIRLFVSAL